MTDLPIYPSSTPLGPNPFPALDRIDDTVVEPCIQRFDRLLDLGEAAGDVQRARSRMKEPAKKSLLEVHRALFDGRSGAGELRHAEVSGIFVGQDCPEPLFVERSLDNFERWLSADSFDEIHPIGQAALTLTRLIDIWPFNFGNRTTALLFSNFFLLRVGYPPFFILPDQASEFDRALSEAIRMKTEPLVGLIYQCMERELNLAGR